MEVRKRNEIVNGPEPCNDDMAHQVHSSQVPYVWWPKRVLPVHWVFIVGLLGVALYLSLSVVTQLLMMWQQPGHATTSLDRLSLTMGLQKRVFAIMFDAGSTGSRIFVFSFHRLLTDGTLKLDGEYFREIKPGLSNYFSNPAKAAESLIPLLEEAKAKIPEDDWSSTPLVLKATAGLRLLPGKKAQDILDQVQMLFDKSPFLVKKNSVSIMDGEDEGLYSWFTVNFLLDKLGEDVKNTVGALDLGGGSTQVCFAPVQEQPTESPIPKSHLKEVTIFNRSISLYVYSYLGLGLMAARLGILREGNSSNDKGSREFASICYDPILHSQWEYAGKKYMITGVDIPPGAAESGAQGSVRNNIARFDECYRIASTVVNSKVYMPLELQHRTVFAMSYYYDRASESGLIEPLNGGTITVNSFFVAARSACSHPDTEQPFACLDLSFIAAFLSQGLGFPNNKEIVLQKKIDGHETSWGLGAAFHELTNPTK